MKIKSLLTVILLFLCSTMIFSQAQKSLQPHQGKIQSIVESANNTFYTAGDDGFVVKWLPDGTGEHFQISDLEIKLIAVSPNGTDIAVYETDGFSIFSDLLFSESVDIYPNDEFSVETPSFDISSAESFTDKSFDTVSLFS
mgnify:CR=1 FL=1